MENQWLTDDELKLILETTQSQDDYKYITTQQNNLEDTFQNYQTFLTQTRNIRQVEYQQARQQHVQQPYVQQQQIQPFTQYIQPMYYMYGNSYGNYLYDPYLQYIQQPQVTYVQQPPVQPQPGVQPIRPQVEIVDRRPKTIPPKERDTVLEIKKKRKELEKERKELDEEIIEYPDVIPTEDELQTRQTHKSKKRFAGGKKAYQRYIMIFLVDLINEDQTQLFNITLNFTERWNQKQYIPRAFEMIIRNSMEKIRELQDRSDNTTNKIIQLILKRVQQLTTFETLKTEQKYNYMNNLLYGIATLINLYEKKDIFILTIIRNKKNEIQQINFSDILWLLSEEQMFNYYELITCDYGGRKYSQIDLYRAGKRIYRQLITETQQDTENSN